MKLEEGQIVLCTVENIVGTNVFVRLDDSGEEGVIVFSEIAPGRIRNIREYVVPKKKIVCKILRLSHGRIDLSLRRVTLKEQKELKEVYKVEKSYESILSRVLDKDWPTTKTKITNNGENTVYEFIENAKENPKELEKTVGKSNAEKILEIITAQQKKRKTEVKKEISLTTQEPLGLEILKRALDSIKNAEIKYISGGKYLIKVESEDAKKADNELTITLEKLEKDAKKLNIEFSIIKK